MARRVVDTRCHESLVAPLQALASTGCPSTKVCVWDFDGLGSDWWYTGGNNINYWDDEWFGTSSTIDNDVESAHNNGTSGKGVYFFWTVDYLGSSWCLPRGEVTDFNSTWDNQPSSHAWSSGCV
ncbi:MAG: peptidase inhibitor family I36 protein [Actinobacteria bacterium]|nr:peptidase inhibitor family I36 protein [Actinomycetota bacterium]MCI0679078.1 peptidase inhibitor family I36 protein [Actinomycetota bacterium]